MRSQPTTRAEPRTGAPHSRSEKSDHQIGSRVGKSKRKVDGSVQLPKNYEILGKFFDSLDSSIRLLRLKGSMPTFTNISPKVENLTDRRFSYAHLAQLKFILPEVIETKKVFIHDERTGCMKPDLHVELNVDAIKNEGKLESANGNSYSYTRKVFHSRLLDFCKAHPEGDVPEENLPEPFNKSMIVIHTGSSNASIPSVIGETSIGVLPESASHRKFRAMLQQIRTKNFHLLYPIDYVFQPDFRSRSIMTHVYKRLM